jgi:hypothetical protein
VTFGAIWNAFGAATAFASGACLASVAALLLLAIVPDPEP